jgi:hypothetical protein
MQRADLISAEAPDLELFEMVNLTTKDTGVQGTIYISTAQGSHGPRVNWYPARPQRDAPSLTTTIEAEPRSINHNLERRSAFAASAIVEEWVRANHEKLLDFWSHGETWTRDEVNAFVDGLTKLPTP